MTDTLPEPIRLAAPNHWSNCATNNDPAYKAGPCDCMPTPAMCRAAVIQHASRAAIQHAAQELHGVVHGGRLQGVMA